MDEDRTDETMPGMSEGAPQGPQGPEPELPQPMGPPVEGRRTQLKIVRENIHSLSNEVGNFRRSHNTSIKRVEAQVAALRSQLAAQTIAKDVGSLRKAHDAATKRLEKQVATLRNELAALKSGLARDADRARAKQEATLARILSKLSAKPTKPAKKKR